MTTSHAEGTARGAHRCEGPVKTLSRSREGRRHVPILVLVRHDCAFEMAVARELAAAGRVGRPALAGRRLAGAGRWPRGRPRATYRRTADARLRVVRGGSVRGCRRGTLSAAHRVVGHR